MSEIVFAREPLAGLLESGLEKLLRAHWEEVAHDRDAIPLDPDWDGYGDDEKARKFVAWGLRKGGELIGYTAFFVVRPRHYKTSIFAMNDVIYVKPAERGIEGLRMIVLAEKWLREQGVTKIFYHAKTDFLLGDEHGDSLEAVERIVELEEEIGMMIPDGVYETSRTLGAVLGAMGYSHVEDHMGKLLAEKKP